jgi:hypothetical protein
MIEQPADAPPTPITASTVMAAVVLVLAVYGCSIYANLSFAVKSPASYRYFPPFKPYANANDNRHLGAEYFNIARSMLRGQGFANPFGEQTGPTAWMPPLLPGLLAGLLWACDGDKDAVMAVVVFLQVTTLVATGLLVLGLARQTNGRLGPFAAAAVFLAGLVCHFHLCFQITHDSWLVLATLDLLVAWLCWGRPLRHWPTAAAWGLFGGLSALVNPIIALAWGAFSLLTGVRQRAWSRLGVALLVGAITLTPWAVRNYLVFGRWIPVKSNLAYELYQSQCLQPDGLIQRSTFASHPYGSATRERGEYKSCGEIAFLDHKREQFWEAVRADPLDFLDRASYRFLGATLWYEPFDRQAEARQPWVLWSSRLAHPLPFLGLLVLLCTSAWRPLHWSRWAVIGVYALYLLPYAAASYYERYAMPLIGIKAVLVVWGADRLLTCWWGERTAGGRRQQTAPVRPHRRPAVVAAPHQRREGPSRARSAAE